MSHFRHVLRGTSATAALSVTVALLAGCGSPGPATVASAGSTASPSPSVPAGATAPVDAGRAALGAAKAPRLATGAAAKKIVAAAVAKPEPRTPYRMTIVDGSGATMTWDVVPPSSSHTYMTSGSESIEMIQIGKRSWIGVGGDWREDPASSGGSASTGKVSAAATMSTKDLLSAVEKPSTDPRVRVFAVVIRSKPKNQPETIRLDRGTGRVIGVSAYDATKHTTSSVIFRYDLKIEITAPEVG